MTQHDMVISDASGATVLTDLNNALQALASTSKGNSAPGTPYSGQLWLDDNTPSSTVWTLSLYDGTDWIVLGYFDSTNNVFTPAAGAGSVGSPSYTFSTDTDTGFYSYAANVIGVACNGALRVLFGDSNYGITATGTSAGHGGHFTGGATNGAGVVGVGQGTATGGSFTGGSSNGTGVGGTGQGSASGGQFSGGSTGNGLNAVGGSGSATYGVYGVSNNANGGGTIGYTQNGSYWGISGYQNTYSFYGNTTSYCPNWSTTSDRRIKQNIEHVTDRNGALQRVLKWKVATYEFAPGWGAPGKFLGYIADELQDASPLAVEGDRSALSKEGMIIPQGVRNAAVDAELTLAVQALHERIAALEQIIVNLSKGTP